jgi:hypothetical protein
MPAKEGVPLRRTVWTYKRPWDATPPPTLVVACSDGRIGRATRRFLRRHHNLDRYARLYVPGGGGALVMDDAREEHALVYQDDVETLIKVHGTTDIVLLFHGPAADGPASAMCGGYRKAFPDASVEELRTQQEEDARRLTRTGFDPRLTVTAYRFEVDARQRVQFVAIGE